MPLATAFQIEAGELWRGEQRLFQELSLDLRDGATTALVGPAGGGKSSLLQALGGRGERLAGRWSLRGVPLLQAERWGFDAEGRFVQKEPGDAGVLLVDQFRRNASAPAAEARWDVLLALLRASPASVWLLDEPLVGASADLTEEFIELLGEKKAGRSILFISHDQRLVRQAADRVCLVCAGSIEQHDCNIFFDHPPSRLAEKFVKSGNCWPSQFPPTIPLPSHFHWVLPGQLAGMGRPGLHSTAEDDLAAISAVGIKILVSLTEEPVAADLLSRAGIEGRHFPITDMGVPAAGPTARLCKFIETRLEAGDPVAVHCHAGLGRTGTILACYLVWQRTPPDEAITRVRAINRYFIQNSDQERFVRWFADQVG